MMEKNKPGVIRRCFRALALSLMSVALVSCPLCLSGCSESPFVTKNRTVRSAAQEGYFTLAEWNVQNLFDAVDDGDEYAEYKSSSGWNEATYKARLERLKTVFSYFDADAVALVEVEGERVVSDLVETLQDYPYCAVAKTEGSPISVALVSRHPISRARVHTVPGARSVLEAEISVSSVPVHVFVIHAKSRLTGVDETRSSRAATARTLVEVSKKAVEAGELVLLAGDFNTTLDDEAVFRDVRLWKDEAPGESSGAVRRGEAAPPLSVSSAYSREVWYSPVLDPSISFDAPGTYCYAGEWETIDHILPSYSPVWVPEDAGIVFRGILESLEGRPARWDRSLLSGVSDHLPTYLTLRSADP